MKNLLNPGWILLIGFLFMQQPLTAQSSQQYDNSLKVQYGIFQYNNNQQDFLSSASNSFLNIGLSFRQRLNRISDLHLSGKYYDWNLKNGDALKTYAFQPMWVLHTNKISSSWRINRLTPYIGIGIGAENHILTHGSADSSYWKMYVPIEAGLQFNLNSRWSLGVFAEYKFASYTTFKNLITSPNKSLDLVNSSGISVSYNFGKNKKIVSFPVIMANPALTDTVQVFKNESHNKMDNSFETSIKNTEIRGILMDMLENEVMPVTPAPPIEAENHQIIVVPKVTSTITDTITVPIHLNISYNNQDEKPAVSKPVKTKTKEKISPAYEKRIDSLLKVVQLQNEKLNSLDNINRIPMKRSAVKDTIVVQTLRTEPAPIPEAADKSQLAATVAQNAGKTETIKSNVQKLQRDLDNTNRKIQKLESDKVKNPAPRVSPTEVNPAPTTAKTDSILRPLIFRDTIIIQMVAPAAAQIDSLNAIRVLKKDTLSPVVSDSVKLIKLSVDSLSQNQKFLMKEMKNLKSQNEELRKNSVVESPKTDSIVKPVAAQQVVYMITFALNSSRFNPKFLPDLKDLADSLKKYPGKKIQLSGYTDKSGKAAYNLVLSQKRVRAVKNELIKMGIPIKQIVEQYFGSELSTGEVNANDRKVVIHLL